MLMKDKQFDDISFGIERWTCNSFKEEVYNFLDKQNPRLTNYNMIIK